MGFILVTFLRGLAQDLPIFITSFFCLWCVFNIYLPKGNKVRKWISLILIEFAEHIILPVVLIFILLIFNNWLAGFFFNLVILLFLFLFLGYFVLKSRTKEEWRNICIISLFVYFFIFLYPVLVIQIQRHTFMNGWWILGLTNFCFFIFYRTKSRLLKE